MTPRARSVGDVVAAIDSVGARRAGRRMVVGVSGFGGAGKSTLARALVGEIDGAVRLRGDDFLEPARSHHRSPDWDGVERHRIRDEVLDPFLAGRPAAFRRYDWSARELGAPERLEPADVLVLDAVGIFHPDLDGFLDLRVWVDVDLEEATRRGMARDAAEGRLHEEFWRDIWVPNERDFAAAFDPRGHADLWYEPAGGDGA
ncbi:uridine kinase [Agromyces cerinus]|uniref:uridine kinase family protein n=1 Tax=Agromyces cerinus TaxID=33878 RepID=UPI001EF7EB26|nr:phosphoglycerate transporter [Agromyces cerinus]MBM7830906.1 uridine kinase [Agromyces cerinus]